MKFWNGLAQFEHQPIGGCMEEEPHLIGERRPAGGAIRGQLTLVQFDQIFHLATRAIERVIDMFGRATCDLGDHLANIEPQFSRFDAGADAALGPPGFGCVVRLRVATQDEYLFQRATGTDVAGLFFDGGGEKLIAGQAENILEAIVLAPIHNLAATIMAIAPDGDPGRRPMRADAAGDLAQMTAHFLAGRRLSRA
jgi:hypothetical protein